MTSYSGRYERSKAARIVGFRTVAMLDYLERTGVFLRSDPKRRGKRRQYGFRDLLVLKVIKSLLDQGVAVHTLKSALEEFQRWKWRAEPSVLEDKDGGLRFLIASAGAVYFAHSADVLVELSKGGQLAFSFVLDLDKLHKDLCEDLGFPRQPELPFEKAI